ncbi:MAG: hypothetical protein RL394_113 [Bacteroidota bacterium]|jgi:hypothetical protein
MKKLKYLLPLFFLIACNTTTNKDSEMQKGTFGYDLEFLRKHHKDLVLLENGDAKLIVLPAYQGRIMTSTAEGNAGASFGWLNHELIASGKFTEHFSAFGGEERFWLGPEGGQFSIYFKKGVDFKFENWFVPKELDTEAFDLVASDKTSAQFEKQMHLYNFSGTAFDLKVNRNISLLNDSAIQQFLGKLPTGVKAVGFQSDNMITNTGAAEWNKSSGMLSIWILSMLNAGNQTSIAIPYKQGDSATLGKIVTDDYFGKVPAERLKVGDGLILFKADGNQRSKIGLSPARALPMAASYDGANNVLTIAQFSLPEGKTDYVNSLWEQQQHPFAGDAVNAYNDGPIEGKQMGKFYELESSSPAATLAPGQSLGHFHRTIHLKGAKADLNTIAQQLLGVGVDALVF